MNAPTTIVKRDTANNWSAKTEVELGEDRVLRISTYKTSNGVLLTSASVQHRTKDGFMTFALYRDYSKVVSREALRCTSANVKLQHEKALAMLDAIRIEATEHYAAEPTTPATT